MLESVCIKKDFPILNQPLAFLDSAASAQKPQVVIDAISHYYATGHANIHRGIYALSESATTAYESVRKQVCDFIHAENADTIVFTKGSTESINLVAHAYGLNQVGEGDEIIISEMEHHANILPWQFVCEKTGATLKVIPVQDNGELDLSAYEQLLSERTKLVAVTHISNVLGTINPVKTIVSLAHQYGAVTLIDGAQAAPHIPVDVQDLDCDFYVFSGHKIYGPTGIGVLYGKSQWLNQMPPYQLGGGIVTEVSFERAQFAPAPTKFEAGTPNIAGVIGLGAAIRYLNEIGFEEIQFREQTLLKKTTALLEQIDGLTILGNPPQRCSVLSFTLKHVHPHDIATIFDSEGIAIRAGHHCAMPLMRRFNVPATARISLGVYNDEADINALMRGFEKIKKVLG